MRCATTKAPKKKICLISPATVKALKRFTSAYTVKIKWTDKVCPVPFSIYLADKTGQILQVGRMDGTKKKESK
jgi:hypothetical protein